MNNFYNEHPYGVGEYVDHLLDEKITMLSQDMSEHISNDNIHVTAEDKERWNSTAEAIFGSSDPSDGDTSSTIIPTKVSDLENDVPYLTPDDMSMYATEEEVRSWLDDYVTKREYAEDDGSGSYSGDNGEYVDGDIIDKFRIDENKTELAGAKYIYLDFENNRLKLKTSKAQTATVKVVPASMEYKTSGSVVVTATYVPADMQSLSLVSSTDATAHDATTPVTYTIASMNNNITFTLHYVPTEDVPGDAYTTLAVSKKYYKWYSSNASETTIPFSTATATLLTGKPSSINVNAGTGNYTYLAFPKSWNVNTANFKSGGFDFGHSTVNGDANGPYSETEDCIIIKSSQTGLNATITT